LIAQWVIAVDSRERINKTIASPGTRAAQPFLNANTSYCRCDGFRP
jgi:hypothetical protein